MPDRQWYLRPIRRNIRSRPRFRFQRRAFPSQGRAPPERAILATFTAMPAEPAPRQPSPALQGLYTQTPDVSAFAVDAKAHPADKAGTWVVGPDQMVLACAFNAMRAEVTKFEATLVALGDRDLEAWEAETIKVRRARGCWNAVAPHASTTIPVRRRRGMIGTWRAGAASCDAGRSAQLRFACTRSTGPELECNARASKRAGRPALRGTATLSLASGM